jgi:hypothetical protein
MDVFVDVHPQVLLGSSELQGCQTPQSQASGYAGQGDSGQSRTAAASASSASADSAHLSRTELAAAMVSPRWFLKTTRPGDQPLLPYQRRRLRPRFIFSSLAFGGVQGAFVKIVFLLVSRDKQRVTTSCWFRGSAKPGLTVWTRHISCSIHVSILGIKNV